MFPFRQVELVGKRFLSVREKNSFRRNSRSSRVSNPLDYEWTTGVIRSCSEKDAHHPELKVRLIVLIQSFQNHCLTDTTSQLTNRCRSTKES